MSVSDDIPVPPGSPASLPEPGPSSAVEPVSGQSDDAPAAGGELGAQPPDAPRRRRRRRRRKPRPLAAAGETGAVAAAGGESPAGDGPAPSGGEAAPEGGENRLHLRPRRHRHPFPRSGAAGAPPAGEPAGEAMPGAPAPEGAPRPRRRRRRPPRNRPPQEGAAAAGAAGEAIAGEPVARPPGRERGERGPRPAGERTGRDPREPGERGPRDPAARERQERGGRDQRRGGKGPRDRKDGPRGRGRDEKKRPEQKLYTTESVVDRGFEDVADAANEGATKRVNWTIAKRMVADQKSGRPVSVTYVLKREEAGEAEFPHLAAARGAVNKTIQHPEKLTKSKAEHATTRKK